MITYMSPSISLSWAAVLILLAKFLSFGKSGKSHYSPKDPYPENIKNTPNKVAGTAGYGVILGGDSSVLTLDYDGSF